MEKDDSVKVELYDIYGKSHGIIQDSFLKAGKHTFTVKGENLNSGIYFVRISTSETTFTRKIIVLK